MRTERRAVVALALIAMVVPISACGASAPAATGSGGGGDLTATAHAKAVKFAECIRGNGVSEFPDPNASGQFAYGIPNASSPLDPSSAAWQHAIGACESLEPPSFMPTQFTPTQRSARLKFAQCVRANGVPDFPDPAATGPLIDVSNGSSIPGLHATIQKCIRLNPEAVQ
ncbi:MAG: hypothetical protein ACLP50_21260 [Solirubrobacteraceae bacterium]